MTHTAPSALGLRLVHAVVFLVLAAPVLWGSADEWRHLAHALARPFHAGPPPALLLLTGALLAGLGALAVCAALLRRSPAPREASWLILAAICLAGVDRSAPSRAQVERSEPRTNLALLEVGRRVHLSMVGALQQQGEVPREAEAWTRALAGATACGRCVRDRRFRPQTPRVLQVSAPDALPAEPLVPGQLLAWVSPDGVAFELRLVGFGEAGRPALLRDPQGGPLVLRGLFNLDLPLPARASSQRPATP